MTLWTLSIVYSVQAVQAKFCYGLTDLAMPVEATKSQLVAIMLNFCQNFRHNLTYSSLITTPLPVRSVIKCDLHTNEFLFPQSEDVDMLTLLFCWLQLEIRISAHMKLLRANKGPSTVVYSSGTTTTSSSSSSISSGSINVTTGGNILYNNFYQTCRVYIKIVLLRLSCCQEIPSALIKACRPSTSPPLHIHTSSSLGSLMVQNLRRNF
uniref:Uncharacterized protein n=1 Tax=Glossina pallidipes TaxID=7398 RepID=A0A1B0A5S0_GLOPL